MWNFQRSWFLTLKFPKDLASKNTWNFQGWGFVLSEISFVQTKSKISGEGVKKVAMSSTLSFGFRNWLLSLQLPCRKLARHRGKECITLH